MRSIALFVDFEKLVFKI